MSNVAMYGDFTRGKSPTSSSLMALRLGACAVWRFCPGARTGSRTTRSSLCQGAVVSTDTRLSVKRYFTNAARPTAAAVSGSQTSVAPSATFVARSPRCGAVSKNTVSSSKSYVRFGPVHVQHPSGESRNHD